MISPSHASQRDELVRRARELVKEDQLQFTLAGQSLDAKFSEETVRIDDPDPLGPGETYAVQETPELVLFMRLGAALDCLRYPDQHRYDNHLDFQANASIEDRRMRARMAVLVLLAAIDPNKGEVIDSSMGEIASIPFELWEYKDNEEQPYFGGSDWIRWDEPGWDHPNEPSTGVLKVFQHAIDVAKHGSIEAARRSRIPSGDGRPCDHDGKNWADECERSLRDLSRFVCHFHYCVTHYRKEWPFRFEEDTRKELLEIKLDNRTWWAKWAGVITRARNAITSVDRPELAGAKQRAFEALCVIADAYQEPLMYLDDEQAGDHLFRGAQEWRAGDEDTKRLQTLSKALDDLEPLRKGCGLYLHEVLSTSDTEESETQDEAEMQSDVEDPPTDTSKKKGRRRTKAEIERDNRLLTMFLIENPTGTKDQAAELIGVSTGTIGNSSPWQRRQLLRRENLKEARPMHIEDLDALADSESSQIRDSNGALPRDSVKIRASHSRRS
jgi:hypothetical protein